MDMNNAFFSVLRKTDDVFQLAKLLYGKGWEIYSSGGTARAFRAHEMPIPVETVSDMVVDFQTRLCKEVFRYLGRKLPADFQIKEALLDKFSDLGGSMLGGRVKTLRPEVASGFLAKDTDEDRETLDHYGYPWFGLACIDLYDLEGAIKEAGNSRDVLESLDVGGVTMLHECAKGHDQGEGRIAIPSVDYIPEVIDWLESGCPDPEKFCQHMASLTWAFLADYLGSASQYFSSGHYLVNVLQEVRELGYAENRWQGRAAIYTPFNNSDPHPLAQSSFVQIAGADPGTINERDHTRLLQTITHIAAGYEVNFGTRPAICVAKKHGNDSGAAVGEDGVKLFKDTIKGDPDAIFGGFVMTNVPVTAEIADTLKTHQGNRVLDGVIAPKIDEDAIKVFQRKDDRCRLRVNPQLANLGLSSIDRSDQYLQLFGGEFLKQGPYDFVLDFDADYITVWNGELTTAIKKTIIVVWGVGSMGNSNTITLGRDEYIIANAVAQQSRVAGSRVAVLKADWAGNDTRGAVAYSDSFFPFPDGVEVLAEAGVEVVFASEAGLGFEKVKEFCLDNDILFVTGPDAVIRGFAWH